MEKEKEKWGKSGGSLQLWIRWGRVCDAYYKFVVLKECHECFCVLHDSRGDKYTDKMGCVFEKTGGLHCMTGNVYVEKYYPFEQINSYENCVGLGIQ